MDRREFKIYSSFDTETTNIKIDVEWYAYPVAYMFGDLYDCDIYNYKLNDEIYSIVRCEEEAIDHIKGLISLGQERGEIPIVVAYNLMFDLQSIIFKLNMEYELKTVAQSSTNVYTLDLYKEDVHLLRFWDCFHLDMRGLQAMGDVCGLPKLKGDWDYTLVRTQQTPLSEAEKGYARRDVQVIPAYLAYLLKANPWIGADDLGTRVLTKTSLVRQMASREIGRVQVELGTGSKTNLFNMFNNLCVEEFPEDYNSYALRKACFRGGFTFTASSTAMVPVHHVCSVDVTSMHHTFINGRQIPVRFRPMCAKTLQEMFDYVKKVPKETVMRFYDKPFPYAFHCQFKFENIRIKEGTCFDRWGIALIPKGKFINTSTDDFSLDNLRNAASDNAIKGRGYVDKCRGGTFAFSKLISADECILYMNEIEAWCVAQVYEWDTCDVVQGEGTTRFYMPPDYVTLQSMRLYKAKDDMKRLLAVYEPGQSDQTLSVPEMLAPMASEIRAGNVSVDFLNSYYQSTVKGMFNAIYGSMAQDVLKPDFEINDGNLSIDKETYTTESNYEEKRPTKCKVLYTYGMRIVAGSRMHLVIAMMLIYERLGGRIDVTGGDTDSMKLRCDADVDTGEILDALKPLHDASTKAIAVCTERARKLAPQWASNLQGVGHFEVEGKDKIFYDCHMELWNKARISWDGACHITCAGLSRPEGTYTFEDAFDDLVAGGLPVDDAMKQSIGFNTHISNSICHALQHRRPDPWEMVDMDVTDYRGETSRVQATQAIAIYSVDRLMGDTAKAVNYESLVYLQERYNRSVDYNLRFLETDEEGKPYIERID